MAGRAPGVLRAARGRTTSAGRHAPGACHCRRPRRPQPLTEWSASVPGSRPDAPHHPRRPHAHRDGRGPCGGRVGASHVPDAGRQRVPRVDRATPARHLSGVPYGYATLWFTTPFFAASLLGSLFAIAMYRHAPRLTFRALPRYLPPEERPAPSLVLGETHHDTRPGRAPDPQWLTIPQRGLYTGVMVLGSVGTGKTSACMYPYVDQLVRWRSHDADHKLGGLVMEVKGDFCRQVRDHAAGLRSRGGLRRGRARHRRLLQPAAQRSRCLRGRLRHCHAAEQPVRQEQGAVLAAGVHRPAEVRHPASTAHRRVHDVCRGLPVHPRRPPDRQRHQSPAGHLGLTT